MIINPNTHRLHCMDCSVTQTILFKHPSIDVVDLPGKGKGFIATAAIPAGTILIKEKPLIHWHRGHYDPITILPRIHGKLDIQVASMSPVNVKEIPEGAYYQADIATRSFQSKSKDSETWARWYFVLETNAFPSGLFPILARCNHSCLPNAQVTEHELDDGAACAGTSDSGVSMETGEQCGEHEHSKYDRPVGAIGSHLNTPAKDGGILYQLTALQSIEAGTEITISYIDAPEHMTRRERQRHLMSQYLFQCQCIACENKMDWEPLRCKSCSAQNELCADCGLTWSEAEEKDEEVEGEIRVILDKARAVRSSKVRRAMHGRIMEQASQFYAASHVLLRRLDLLLT